MALLSTNCEKRYTLVAESLATISGAGTRFAVRPTDVCLVAISLRSGAVIAEGGIAIGREC